MKYLLLGGIIGDICGSVYEFSRWRTKDISKVNLYSPHATFTDDTICTIAVADYLITGEPIEDCLVRWVKKYNARGCAGMFKSWVYDDNRKPYGSWGNGAAMRISPVGFLPNNLIYSKAEEVTNCTHNCKESLEAVHIITDIINALYTNGSHYSKSDLQSYLSCTPYKHIINTTLDEIRPTYGFHVACQESVPESILCFLESEDYEHCIKLAISMGGDADTMACIAGSIAYPYYQEIPEKLIDFAIDKLDDDIFDVICKFDEFIKWKQ